MPLYQQIIATMPKYPADKLVSLFQSHAKVILEHKGIVRGIEHHGIRPLPEQGRRSIYFIRYSVYSNRVLSILYVCYCIQKDFLLLIFHFLSLFLTMNHINRKYASTDGARATWDARFHTVTFDVAPVGLTALQRLLAVDEGILKAVTFKMKGSLERVHAKNYKNPYHKEAEERPTAALER